MLGSIRLNSDALENKTAKEKDALVGALREWEVKAERDPLSLYFPHKKQHLFHSFRSSVRCFFGGNQSGKTTCGLADDLIQALDEEDLPSHLREYKMYEPPFLCRIMAPSFPVLETTLYEKLQAMVPRHTLVGDSWAKAFDKNTRVLYFKNGSRFFFQTYEMDVAKMGGATLDRVHYDEEPPLAARNECRIRVMARGGDEIFTMTPVEGLTWSFDSLWKHRGHEVLDGVYLGDDINVVTVDMDDNPALTEEAKRLAMVGLSREERQARKEGKFVALHGLVYGEFRRETHVIPQIQAVPERVNVVVGIDPGIRGKAAVVWLYLTGNDQMVVFEEGYFDGMTVRHVAENIHKVNALYEIEPIYYVIDPSARNKEHQTGRSDQMEYADHGIVAIAGQNAVPAGINRIKERLERSGGLLIADNCTHLIEEMMRYRWKEPPRSGEDGPAKVVKKDDHLLDALRYAVMSRPYLPAPEDQRQESELEQMMREDRERPESDPETEFGGVFA